jgi:hypothetical protein
MSIKLFASSECAKIVGVAEHRINYARRVGRIKSPTYYVAGKWIYSEADIREIAKYFGVQTGSLEMEAK